MSGSSSPFLHAGSLCFRSVAIGAMLVAVAQPVSADVWSSYATLLEQHTRATTDLAQTRVDYTSLRKEPAWAALIGELEATNPASLDGRAATLAYWINVYNILAIDVVVKGNPKQSIRDLGGTIFNKVWDQPAGRIAGKTYTLGQIEHEILRPLGDARVHGAIVCASHSCPPLARTPYRAENLDADLTANLERWLAQPQKGARIDRTSNTVYLSRIFDWFGDDFGGEQGALDFAATYAPEADRRWLRENAKTAEVEYLPYDWSLNGL